MATETAADPFQLAYYEGLIFATTRRIERHVEMEADDIAQRLRIKAWRSIERFDHTKSKMSVDRFVFQCLVNEVKDILKKRRHNELHIEDFFSPGPNSPSATKAGTKDSEYGVDATRFATRFLSVTEESVYDESREDPTPDLPGCLSPRERRVARMLIEDFTQAAIAAALKIRLKEVREIIATIRLKMLKDTPSLSRYVEAPELARAA